MSAFIPQHKSEPIVQARDLDLRPGLSRVLGEEGSGVGAEVYNTHRWRQLVKHLVRPGAMCEIEECAEPSREILFGLRPRHPLGPSLDHIIELQYGGAPFDPANLRPAHLGCNVRKSNRLRREEREGLRRIPARAGRAAAAIQGQGRSKRTSQAFDTDR